MYTGTLMKDLEKQVERVEQALACPQSGQAAAKLRECLRELDELAMDEMLSRDPVLVLVGGRSHLADKQLTAGDVQAWFLLGEKLVQILEEPEEDDGQKMIREGLSRWQQGQVGCFD